MSKVKALIFDCFGVIISDALSVMCSELALKDPEGVAEVWHLINQANRGVLTSDEASTQVARVFGLTLAEYRARIAAGEQKDQQLLDYILSLRANCKTAMLSNVSVGSLARRFAPDELERYFDAVVASGEVGYAKPDPEAYRIAAEHLDVPAEACVFVDDRELHVDGALAVGMRGLLYQGLPRLQFQLEALLADS